ncbi:hypothetical protein [Microvirga vignae]|uniref:hypothetical protein n=1 Tax=Microvirga vignae TaxID=1225564 RepID=UPI00069C4481|nr:hypothetical protein [Microvirga vignae]
MPNSKPPVLMSPENPTGWKLEELLGALQHEVHNKCARIARDDRPVAKAVLRNNHRIIDLLRVAMSLQEESLAALASIAPDPGPLGKPRIGEGSGA